MQATIHSTKPRKAKRNKIQARFDRLSERIEREQRKNDKLFRELDELARWLAAQRQDIERIVLAASHRLGTRLIEFFKRKSLSEWHREELVEWIAEMREQVSAIDPEAGAELHQRFVEAVGVHLDMSEDEMEARFREHFEGDDAEFDFDAADECEDDVQPDLFGDEDDLWREAEWNGRDEHAREAGPAEEAAATDSRLADAGWLRRLFRRAAQALHPDRETDPDRRAHKHDRMQELLRARKDGDVLAMLGLYAEASGSEELALAETEMKQACELMQQRLERLQYERAEITGQSPLHAWAHQEFYRFSRAQREQKIKRWEREAQAEARDVTRIADELKNLKVLKAHLSRRREQKYAELNNLDGFFDSLFR